MVNTSMLWGVALATFINVAFVTASKTPLSLNTTVWTANDTDFLSILEKELDFIHGNSLEKELDFIHGNSLAERKRCVKIRKCTNAGGSCIESRAYCDGIIDTRFCKGKKCKCCIPDKKWSGIRYACIRGNNYRSLETPTIDDCKTKCVEEQGIVCKSLDYYPASRQCHLSGLRSDSSDYTEPCYLDGWLYAEREFHVGKKWSSPTNACIKGNNHKTLKALNFEICKAWCVEEVGVDCRSIEYQPATRECHISGLTDTSSSFTEPCYLDGWLYAERN